MRAFQLKAQGRSELVNLPPPAAGENEVLVQLAAAGICGSDIHYFKNGACGEFVIDDYLVPGHEASGIVQDCGAGVTRLSVGDHVAINPSLPCGVCKPCTVGCANLCTNNRFMGSASRKPHSQGMMQELFVVKAEQCLHVPDNTNMSELAMAEPLSVALHAVARAGSLKNKRVLVAGGGTIGLLVALCAKRAGANSIILSDPVAHARKIANSVGITQTLDPSDCSRELATRTGWIDVAFEASGSEFGLADCIRTVAAGGTIVQVGTLPTMSGVAPINQIMTRGINLHGAFRFDQEFNMAVDLITHKKIDVSYLISAQFPIEQAQEAFELAADTTQSTKVQIVVS